VQRRSPPPMAVVPRSAPIGRWLPLVTGLFVTVLIISNIVAVKLVSIGPLVVTAAIVLFPISYIVADVLTEVYGYAVARRTIWIGFLCNLVAVLAIMLGGAIPAASFWQDQSAYDAILGYSSRLLVASFIAYLGGEFLNAFVLAKLKVRTAGRHLWLRTISSTVLGQAVDSALFVAVAFAGVLPADTLVVAMASQWAAKVLYETAATPLTYLVVRFLKRSEGVDHYDRDTRFNPLALRERRVRGATGGGS
jgi:uncharacterized integral membrane protein (TIGR00697 family)